MLSWLEKKTQKPKGQDNKKKIKPYPICHGKKDKRTNEISK
jgi:hypothetical protein